MARERSKQFLKGAKSVHLHEGQQRLQAWVGELLPFQPAKCVSCDAGFCCRLRLSEPPAVPGLTKSTTQMNSRLFIWENSRHTVGSRSAAPSRVSVLVIA